MDARNSDGCLTSRRRWLPFPPAQVLSIPQWKLPKAFKIIPVFQLGADPLAA